MKAQCNNHTVSDLACFGTPCKASKTNSQQTDVWEDMQTQKSSATKHIQMKRNWCWYSQS